MKTKTRAFKKCEKCLFIILAFFIFANGVYAQTKYDFPAGDYWSLDGGIGMGNFLVNGAPFQGVIDPKLWLSPALNVGTRVGVNYSNEKDYHDILTIEGQVYMRWNFLHLGKKPEKTANLFVQGGLGIIAAYRGWKNPFDDVERTRGSVLLDAELGATIPLTSRWHIEPTVRGGYPHIWGISLTTGYKFPLPRVIYEMAPTKIELIGDLRPPIVHVATLAPPPAVIEPEPLPSVAVPSEPPPPRIGSVAAIDTPNASIEYVEVIRTVPAKIEYVEVLKILPPTEIVKRIVIPSIEFVIFGPDIGSYNVGIDSDAQQLNELVISASAKMLKEDPTLKVRIEGHANPYTINVSEHDELMALSAMRANVVAQQLREKGVSDGQMVIISLGGTRNATTEWDVRNRNRRVELMIVQFIPE